MQLWRTENRGCVKKGNHEDGFMLNFIISLGFEKSYI